MTITAEDKKKIALGLHSSGLVQFGEFTYKSGIVAPIYNNLRNLGSHPHLLKEVASLLGKLCKPLEFDLLAGIPYGAIPVMMATSLELDVPVIFPRKESKEYGMGKDLLGDFEPGQKAVLIDDLITTGGSKMEALVPITAAGIEVTDLVCVLDYDRGASEMLAKKGLFTHRIMTTSECVDFLAEDGLIDEQLYKKVHAFLTEDRCS